MRRQSEIKYAVFDPQGSQVFAFGIVTLRRPFARMFTSTIKIDFSQYPRLSHLIEKFLICDDLSKEMNETANRIGKELQKIFFARSARRTPVQFENISLN